MLTALILTGAFAKVQITELKVGSGAPAKKGDVLTLLYKGTLKNGRIFDETTAKKPPYAIKLGAGEVIDGWEQGLVGIKAGGKRKLVVPYALAYGDKQYSDIPPKSDLTFVVECIRLDTDKTVNKLVVKEVKAGKGATAKTGDTVTIHYTGKFLNGFQFDSSVGGEPYTFRLGSGSVIEGFDKGITGMKKGGKRKVTIPYAMAYKEKGRGSIPKYATLVFDLELVSLK